MIKESMQEVVCLLILSACLNSIIEQVTGSNTNQPGTDAYKNISFSIEAFLTGYVVQHGRYLENWYLGVNRDLEVHII